MFLVTGRAGVGRLASEGCPLNERPRPTDRRTHNTSARGQETRRSVGAPRTDQHSHSAVSGRHTPGCVSCVCSKRSQRATHTHLALRDFNAPRRLGGNQQNKSTMNERRAHKWRKPRRKKKGRHS